MGFKIFKNLFKSDKKENIENVEEVVEKEEELEKEDISKEEIIKEEKEDISKEEIIKEEKEDIFKEEIIKEEKEDISKEEIIKEEKEDISKEEIIKEEKEDISKEEVIKEEKEEIFKEDNKENIEEEPKNLFQKLKAGLKKTSSSFSKKFENLFKSCIEIDEDLFEELEEILITSDISYETSMKIVDMLKDNIKTKGIDDISKVKEELKEVVKEILKDNDETLILSKEENKNERNILIVVGVNGVGKTTSIGKIGKKLKDEGKSVLFAAGDTFRAAASEQLTIWANRINVPIVKYETENADPAAVIFDSIKKAKAQNIDVVIADTAGRLHNKVNLMNELKKIVKTAEKEYKKENIEILLVIDATTGQNALNQVKMFNEACNLTGIVLTKLDGSAKGGIVLSIVDTYKIPVKFVGVGEKVEDLQVFKKDDFANLLFE